MCQGCASEDSVPWRAYEAVGRWERAEESGDNPRILTDMK